MLQGMTAHYLTHSTYPLKNNETALVHAAAGGVGLLLVPLAKMRGARVFATVSTEAKAQLAKQAGADEAILYTQAEFSAETKRLTTGVPASMSSMTRSAPQPSRKAWIACGRGVISRFLASRAVRCRRSIRQNWLPRDRYFLLARACRITF